MRETANTETPQQNVRYLNAKLLDQIERGQEKQAAEDGNPFIRQKVRQASSVRSIIEPKMITEADLVPSLVSDSPMTIVDREPDSFATFVPFNTTPQARWYKGARFPVYFAKITSPDYVKDKYTLMSYRYDIRKLIADNLIKDGADEEEKRWKLIVDAGVAKDANRQSTGPAFVSKSFTDAMGTLTDRRRPLGKMHMLQSQYLNAINLPATSIGNDVATRHYEKGMEGEKTLWGYPVVTTMKADIYDKKRVYFFAPEEFLGKFYMLQDATLFIKQEAENILFRMYYSIGIGVANLDSIQVLDLP